MPVNDDGLQPPYCEDEISQAFLYVDEAAARLGIEPIDIRFIARASSKAKATAIVDNLKSLHKKIRQFDSAQIISDSVKAYNQTSTQLVFSECVGVTMRIWENSQGVQPMSIWATHPSNFNSLRTYIWAQSSFRKQAEWHAGNRLTQLSPIGMMHDLDVHSPEHIRIGSPVVMMMSEARILYSAMLGAYPLPE